MDREIPLTLSEYNAAGVAPVKPDTYSYETFLINTDGEEIRFAHGKGKSALEMAHAVSTHLLMNEQEAANTTPTRFPSHPTTRISITKD
jgi:hypothetical protein